MSIGTIGWAVDEDLRRRIDRVSMAGYRPFMRSELAQHASKELIEAARKLTPEQRLAAFFEHSRLMVQLYLAGQRQRAGSHPSRSKSING